MLFGLKISALLFKSRFFLIAIVCFWSTFATAQLCNGSLGDPVVNINFGTGSSNTTPTNGYIYTSSTCPNDGYYTVTNSTTGCFNNSWLSVTADHTGGGAFMLVNASVTPGDFFLNTVSDLCPNTTYEFAAWIMNVMVPRNGIKPNITFKIETPGGVLLQQYSTGDVPETAQPSWRQYGFYFTTPINNPVIVLRMTNNAPGGNGNDLALDDITFRPCGPAFVTADIPASNDTVNICDNNTNQYTFNGAVSVGYTAPVYQWQVSTNAAATWTDIAGANALVYQRTPTAAGDYLYRLTVTEQSAISFTACRIASNVLAVNVHAKPEVSAGPDKIVFAKDSVTLDGTATGDNLLYYWDPPIYLNNSSLLTPLASPASDIGYTIYATSQFGCTNQDAMQVKVVAGIFIPNAFTPNGDGKNDHWRIPFLYPQFGAVVNVFNRYGQLLYHSEGGIVDWDGKLGDSPQPAGAYIYHIRYKKSNGEVNLKGTIMLIR